MKNWYIVQSHSSFENKVAGLIKEEADKAKISDKFEETPSNPPPPLLLPFLLAPFVLRAALSSKIFRKTGKPSKT